MEAAKVAFALSAVEEMDMGTDLAGSSCFGCPLTFAGEFLIAAAARAA